ncbi:MAG TPA: DUF4397 domain-containing protein [Gemmatimonadaceae bacterium]
MFQHFRLTRITRPLNFRALAGIGIVAGVAAIAGCNTDTTTTSPNGPQGLVQFINAAPRYSSVDLYVDTMDVAPSTTYGTGQSISLTPLSNPRQFVVRLTGDTTTLASGQLLIVDQAVSTVILTQHTVGGNLLILPDTVSAPPANDIGLRIVNASPSAATVDMYVTGADSTLATPTATNVAFEGSSTYVTVPVGTVRVRVTTAGTKTVLLDIDASSLTAGQVRTVLLVDSAGGGLPVTWLAVPDRG